MELGKRQTLKVVRIKDFGLYLADIADIEGENAVLLPIKQAPDNARVGMDIEVFIYKDSQDRLISTTRYPIAQVGELARFRVKDMSRIGAFIDIGLEKDVLIPYKEMRGSLAKGDEVLAYLYVDRSERLAATMNIYKYLSSSSPYAKDDEVSGIVYEVKDIGVKVAVDDKYYGLIPKNEIYVRLNVGDSIKARVIRVREDGKLDLSIRQKAYIQLSEDMKLIEAKLEVSKRLELGDKSSPELIKSKLGLSKNAFKRAIGHLLKENKIIIEDDYIEKQC